jgi:DNA-directed RNA polymerase specialized sigma subunit
MIVNSAAYEYHTSELRAAQQALQELIDTGIKIHSAMNVLNVHEKKIIRLVHKSHLKWREIQLVMHYSERQPYRVYKKAIKKLLEVL